MTSAPQGVEHRAGVGRRLAFALFTVAFGTNVPTPLLLIYRRDLHLSASVLTAVFGVYAAGLVPAILLAGPLSDRWGRRRVALPAVAASAVGTALFLPAAHAPALLFAGRFVQGLVSGVVFSVCTAWLTELAHAEGLPGPAALTLAGRRASVAQTAGFSLGPLTGGLLGQFAPAPLVLPYLVHLLLVTAGFVVVVGIPETLARRATGPLIRLQLRAGTAGAFWIAMAPTAVAVYTFASVPISTLPLLLPPVGHPVAFAGLLGAVTLGVGTLAASRAHHLGTWGATAALSVGAAGFVVCLLAVHAASTALALLAAAVLGVGNGLSLAAGLTLAQRLADPLRRGAVTSAFYAIAYVGFGAPFLTATVDRHAGVDAAFGVLVVAFVVFAAMQVVSGRDRARTV